MNKLGLNEIMAGLKDPVIEKETLVKKTTFGNKNEYTS